MRAARAWFAFGVRFFAVALPLGLAFALFAPVEFVRLLGAVALAGSAAGLLVSVAGRRLERTTPGAQRIAPYAERRSRPG